MGGRGLGRIPATTANFSGPAGTHILVRSSLVLTLRDWSGPCGLVGSGLNDSPGPVSLIVWCKIEDDVRFTS